MTFLAIGIIGGKTPENLGMLWRSAHLFGADVLFTAGARYERRQACDTSDATRQIPLYEFDDFEDLQAWTWRRHAQLVGIEQSPYAEDVATFEHPREAVYLLGAEDRGLSPKALRWCSQVVTIPTAEPWSMNVAVAGSIVLHDRHAKARQGVPA